MFRAHELSPLEFARFLLERVERHAGLGTFISVFPELLIEQAEAATVRLMRGDDLPLLHGLPVTVKDSIFTKGQRTTLGSLLFKDHVPEVDSVASERLKQAGAIIFAKTNIPEFALFRRTFNLLTRDRFRLQARVPDRPCRSTLERETLGLNPGTRLPCALVAGQPRSGAVSSGPGDGRRHPGGTDPGGGRGPPVGSRRRQSRPSVVIGFRLGAAIG